MPRKILSTLILALLVAPHGARAQSTSYETSVEGSGYEDMAVGESRDVPCEYGYSARFHSHYGVEFEGQMFMSQWLSKVGLDKAPLPSWNWYYAYPMRTVVSNNGKYRWEDAEIQVHCWVYRALYVITHHRDHVASLGRLVELCGDDWEEIESRAYDDGVTAPNSMLSTTCGGDEDGGGGRGGDGGSTWRCYTVTIDHYYYYPDTGEVEYRYTEQYSYCEEIE